MSNDSSKPAAAKHVPWNIPAGVGYAIVVFFTTQIIAGLLVAIIPAARHQNVSWWLNTTAGQFAYVLLAEAMTIAAVIAFVRLHKTPLRRIGLGKMKVTDPLIAVPAYVVYLIAFLIGVVLIERFVPSIDVNQTQEIGFADVHGTMAYVLTFVSLVILPPIAEEILMRGLIFTSLRKHLKWTSAALITSALFASAHLPEGGAAGPLYIAAVDTFLLSLMLCYLREKTGRLYAGITVHMLKNLVAFISLFVLVAR